MFNNAQYISASMLGVKNQQLYDQQTTSRLIGGNISYTKTGVRFPSGTLKPQNYILAMGTYRHRQYQAKSAALTEYTVRTANIKGSIDVLHGANTFGVGPFSSPIAEKARLAVAGIFGNVRPEELKTVDTDYLRQMREPKRAAVSQLNAYMYAVGADTGTITYISRQNANERRSFEVPFQPGLLISDISNYRQQQFFPETIDTPLGMHYNRIQHHRRGAYNKRSDASTGYIGSRMYR